MHLRPRFLSNSFAVALGAFVGCLLLAGAIVNAQERQTFIGGIRFIGPEFLDKEIGPMQFYVSVGREEFEPDGKGGKGKKEFVISGVKSSAVGDLKKYQSRTKSMPLKFDVEKGYLQQMRFVAASQSVGSFMGVKSDFWNSDEIVYPTPPNGSDIVLEYTLTPISRTDKSHAGYQPKIKTVVMTGVELDKQIKYVFLKESDPIEVPKKGKYSRTLKHTVKHSLSVQKGYTIGGELRLNFPVVEIGIRGSIERSTNRTYEESEESGIAISIDGGNDPVKMVWYETYRTGKAVTYVNGQRYEIPFEFRDGWDLRLEPIKKK